MKTAQDEPMQEEISVLDPRHGGLVLCRGKGEEIVIGRGPGMVVVSVEKLRSDRKVNLRVRAPAEVPVHRREVYDRIQTEPDQGGHHECRDKPHAA